VDGDSTRYGLVVSKDYASGSVDVGGFGRLLDGHPELCDVEEELEMF